MEATRGVEQVVLWGDEHPDLGNLVVASAGELTAVALSAGRFPKPYAHLDPNEDAVLGAAGPAGVVLAVADGHNGFDAARAALAGLREQVAFVVDAPVEDPTQAVRSLLSAAQRSVARSLADAAVERRSSRTTLSVGLLSDGWVHAATWGDSAVGRVRGRRLKRVCRDGPFLNGSSEPPEVGRARLKDGDVVVACSDGLLNYMPGSWQGRAPQIVEASPEPAKAAQALIESAWTGGAGDHVSVAVARWEGA